MNKRKQFGCMLVDGNTLLFISSKDIFPALYKVDLLTKRSECLGEVPWEYYADESALIGKIDDMLIIAPRCHQRKFLKYDMTHSLFQVIWLDEDIWERDFSISAFSNVVRLGNSLFFVGNKSAIIVEYRKDSDDFVIHKLILPIGLSKEELSFFWCSAVLEENELYLPFLKGGLIKIDLKDFHVAYIEIPHNYQCFSMAVIDDYFWMMPNFGNKIMLFQWKSKEYHFIEVPIKSGNIPFMAAVDWGSEILLIPMHDETIFSIDKLTYMVSKKVVLNRLANNSRQRQFLLIYRNDEGNTYLQKSRSHELWCFSKNGDFEKETYDVTTDNIQELFAKSKMVKNKFWTESINVGIDFWLDILKGGEEENEILIQNCGLNIWTDLKRANL